MRLAGVTLGVLLPGATAWAAEADSEEATKAAEVFQSLYGADLERARASRDSKDDLELASRILTGAKESVSQPARVTVLCEKVCELASAHPEGYAIAIEALELEVRAT